MENQHYKASNDTAVNQTEQFRFYLDHLNKIYCTYSHLAERLSELIGNEQLEELGWVMDDIVNRSASQLELLEHIYGLIRQEPSTHHCIGLTQFLEDNFSKIHQLPTLIAFHKSSMLSYLQYSNSILMTSFQLIQLGAEAAFNTQACHLINSLIVLAQNENAILPMLT